jgi:hypothetical protein
LAVLPLLVLAGCSNGGIAQNMPQPVSLPDGKLGYSFTSLSSFDDRPVSDIADDAVKHFKLCPGNSYRIVSSNDRKPSMRIVDVVIACK